MLFILNFKPIELFIVEVLRNLYTDRAPASHLQAIRNHVVSEKHVPYVSGGTLILSSEDAWQYPVGIHRLYLVALLYVYLAMATMNIVNEILNARELGVCWLL
jgi:hypothetical protein